jgi:hypothetical protein
MASDATVDAVDRTGGVRQLTAHWKLKTRSRSDQAFDHRSLWTAPTAS